MKDKLSINFIEKLETLQNALIKNNDKQDIYGRWWP